jgi:hypothetical protein
MELASAANAGGSLGEGLLGRPQPEALELFGDALRLVQ